MTTAHQWGPVTSRHGDAEVTTRADGGRLDVAIGGDVDLSNAADIAAAIQRGNPPSFEHVEVDLAAVSYLDSAGLSMLVDLARQLHTGRSRLVCRAPDGSAARRIIALTGLLSVLHVEDADAS